LDLRVAPRLSHALNVGFCNVEVDSKLQAQGVEVRDGDTPLEIQWTRTMLNN
ncbi:uncharacterized protein EI90DRAFT_3037653, partial [Cantharellus anzutake]|uniref:uncharacterized protein n=1 Tax=Cantharellus anzutake TaxID=1750568 RepID=UPI001907DADC